MPAWPTAISYRRRRRVGKPRRRWSRRFAEARGWDHGGRRELHQAVEWLVVETGQPELRSHFSAANTLRANFYDDFLEAEDVRAYLEAVECLVELLGPLAP